MYAPVIRKLNENMDIFIERSLPVKGLLAVEKGSTVKPFDRLGDCVFSQRKIELPKRFRPEKRKENEDFFHIDTVLGSIGKEKIIAQFNGHLKKRDDNFYEFCEEESKYTLLSGLWGTVHEIAPNHSVLIKTQTKDLLLSISTPFSSAGELVVFPNPTEILEKHYLGGFSKNNKGKIIYVGHSADMELIDKAASMKVAGILCGSLSKEVFDYAIKKEIPLGVISGFGKIDTPEEIFNLLSIIAYRYVFFHGDRNLLRIPIESPEEKKKSRAKSILKKVRKGTNVQVFQSPYFGRLGTVDKVLDFSVKVKFDKDKEGVEIKLPNFYIVE